MPYGKATEHAACGISLCGAAIAVEKYLDGCAGLVFKVFSHQAQTVEGAYLYFSVLHPADGAYPLCDALAVGVVFLPLGQRSLPTRHSRRGIEHAAVAIVAGAEDRH